MNQQRQTNNPPTTLTMKTNLHYHPSPWFSFGRNRRNLFVFLSLTILVQWTTIEYQQNRLKPLVLSTEEDATSTSRRSLSSCPSPPPAEPFAWDIQPQIKSQQPPTWLVPDFQPTRPLNFVHIPKNAGSSIVEAAIQANLNWGDCLFQQEWPGRQCPHPPTMPYTPPEEPSNSIPWHLPVFLLDENPYTQFDLFVVLRNPYDRAVSEFYYRCDNFPGHCKGLDGHRAARVLNRNIQLALKTQYHAPHKSEDYVTQWSHWIPQHDFVYHRNGKRLVEHALHVELLQEEFPSLMKAYNYSNITLPPVPVKQRHDNRMTVQNLTMETIKLIEVVYERDFEVGGYPVWSPQLHAQLEQHKRQQEESSTNSEK